MARRPGHSALVVLMLGLGIGGGTAIFGLIDSMLLAPLPYEQPERLVVIDQTAPRLGRDSVPIDYADLHAWRENSHSFESLALTKRTAFNLVAGEAVERIEAVAVTHDLARILGVRFALGRTFTPRRTLRAARASRS